MLTWILLFLACVTMYRVAEMGQRRGWLWAIICFAAIFVIDMLMPFALFSIPAGWTATFLIMFGANLVAEPKRVV